MTTVRLLPQPLLMALTALLAPLAAQEVPPAPPPLPLPPAIAPAAAPSAPAPAALPPYTLAQALADAQRLNDTSEIASARLDAALAARRQALSLLLPTLTASGTLGTTDVSHQPWGGPATRYAGDGAVLNLSLFNAAALPGYQAASIAVSAQALLSSDLRRQLSFQVVAGYLAAISAEQTMQAAQQILAVSQESLRETQARTKVGLNSENDATRAELDVANANLALTNDHQAVVAARLGLGDLVGHLVEQPLSSPGAAEIPPGDGAALEALARQRRPDLLANVLQIRLEERIIRANRNLYYPSLGVLASYQDEGFRPTRPPGAEYPIWTAALSATWTLYDGGLREGEIDAAEDQRRQLAALEHAARQDLHRDLLTAIANLATQGEVVEQAKVAVRVAEVNEQEVRTRYTQGLATQLDVSDAFSALFSARVSRIAADIAYANARYQLRLLVGWWPLSQVDPLPPRK